MPDNPDLKLVNQGAEAKIYTCSFLGKPTIVKERFTKSYRHPALDKTLTSQRTKSEVRCIMRCRTIGICTPAVYYVDLDESKIYMEYVADSVMIKEHIIDTMQASSDLAPLIPLVEKIGRILGVMHRNDIIHGDLTTSNMLLVGSPQDLQVVLIDFGLGYIDGKPEDKGVDLYVLERAFLSTHPFTEILFDALLRSYVAEYGRGATDVIAKLEEVRLRGRKRTMVG